MRVPGGEQALCGIAQVQPYCREELAHVGHGLQAADLHADERDYVDDGQQRPHAVQRVVGLPKRTTGGEEVRPGVVDALGTKGSGGASEIGTTLARSETGLR